MARRLAAALALLLVAAACGSDSPNAPRTGAGITADTTPGASTTTVAADAGTTRTTRGGAAPRPSATDDGSNGDAGSASSTREQIDEVANGPVGAFAGLLLAPGPVDSIVLDVRFGDGATPDAAALSAAADAMRTYSGKPTTISGPTALRGVGGGSHSATEIRDLASKQGRATTDGVGVVHVLYLAGSFEKEGVLGVAVRGDTLALFSDEMDAATSPFVARSRMERAVIVHELGHVLGLVDLFLDDNREDPEHPGHSRNRASVMYWAVETSLVGQVLGGPPPVEFDSDDISDLRRIHAGAR